MGIINPFDEESVVIEELRRMLLSCSAVHRRKEEDRFNDQRPNIQPDDDTEKLVCVTSGVSFLGLSIVNRLLLNGYSVRVLVTNQEDMEKLREIDKNGTSMMTAVMANINDIDSLSEAFNGCRGIFHTSAFVDPAGLSGYSKAMADIELKACEHVMEACARTSSVRSCVLTSSLLTCLWQEKRTTDPSTIVNHDSWSDQSVCLDKKLWYALGKLKAEKSAWNIAEKSGLRLVTICGGLVTGPEVSHRNPTATFAYLKGVQEMYANGLLATVDVGSLADAHVVLYEAMDKTAFGRYVCFDDVIQCENKAAKLAQELGLKAAVITGNSQNLEEPSHHPFQLSNVKLSNLMLRRLSCNDYNS
ncbi:cinnamoyl-CoA reductase-like SNL6 [Impatiens glandulifera]|uniref:cinnamoyl-CoA reductase-like SNL6 n=1 Tax=Impatiens glandulifera TaxID=253017 RepID=UPI001FB19DC7|nr:cinnamoyl-CoA reductase-like SNL6 [Impatiens glandulifera]